MCAIFSAIPSPGTAAMYRIQSFYLRPPFSASPPSFILIVIINLFEDLRVLAIGLTRGRPEEDTFTNPPLGRSSAMHQLLYLLNIAIATEASASIRVTPLNAGNQILGLSAIRIIPQHSLYLAQGGWGVDSCWLGYYTIPRPGLRSRMKKFAAT